MPFPRKFNPELGDIKLIIDLIKERDRLYQSVEDCSAMIERLTKDRAEFRRQARLITCESIADKFDLNKDVIYCIGKCISFKKEIESIDPEFYRSKTNRLC